MPRSAQPKPRQAPATPPAGGPDPFGDQGVSDDDVPF